MFDEVGGGWGGVGGLGLRVAHVSIRSLTSHVTRYSLTSLIRAALVRMPHNPNTYFLVTSSIIFYLQ